MARLTFGGGTADYLETTDGRRVAGSVTMWTAAIGGTQVTDLLVNGVAVSSVASDRHGLLPEFLGPDGVSKMYAQGGVTRRVVFEARDAASAAAGGTFIYRGLYVAGTAYVKDDLVNSAGNLWVASVATTGNTPPATAGGTSAFWTLWLAKGDTGPQGAAGATGAAGASLHTDSTYLEPFPVWSSGNAFAIVSGDLYLMYGTAGAAVTLTRLSTAITEAGVGQTLVKLGAYTVGAAGALTQVAATASDPTIATTAFSAPTRAVTAVTIAAGQRYALAFLSVGGTTQPNMKSNYMGSGIGSLLRRFGSGAGPATGKVPGQADLPATLAAASVVGLDDSLLLLGRPA